MDFFENPELLLGVPFLVLGLVGVGIAAATMFIPQPAAGAPAVVRGGHPDDAQYIKIGIALAVITAIEIALFYVSIHRAILITVLIVLSAAKFALVVMWFMHLRFDSTIFTTAFVTGLVLAAAVFTVVLATLGGNLI